MEEVRMGQMEKEKWKVRRHTEKLVAIGKCLCSVTLELYVVWPTT